METGETTLTGKQLRVRLFERGIRVTDLARAAGMGQSDLSGILTGRRYVGPVRKARLERAVAALGLDRDAAPAAPYEPVFRIHHP